VYRLDVSDPIVRKLYPNFETNTSTLSNFIHVDSSINIEKIDKPIISYNEDTNTYLINYLAKDSNNVFCNIFEEFVITNSNIKFLNYVCYKPEYYIQDYNFTYNYSNTAIRFNNLTANLSCYQDLSRSILWFGASSIPVNIVPGFITCDTGIVFDEIVITPDPTPTVTPTPTITPTPTPTPTVPDWYNTCYTHRVCVFGSPISELNAVYTLTAGYYDSISGVPIFSTVYANDNNSKILIKFNPDNQVLHGAILSAYDDDFNSYTFFYGSTSAVPDYTCVPYGVYNTRVVYEPYLDATITFTGPAPYPTVSFYSIT
jgi:hypothetical protein